MKQFLKIIVPLALACVSAASCVDRNGGGEPLRMLVGTYTKGNDSKGVYYYEFDEKTVDFRLLDTARAWNPSFVIPSADGRSAYCVCESADGREGACAFSLGDTAIDSVNFSSNVPEGRLELSGAPCNIVVVGKHAITSNYRGGTLSVFPLEEDGSLGAMSHVFVPENDPGIVSHMHCATLSPDGKHLYANDLGADIVYRFDVVDGEADMENPHVAYRLDRDTHPGPRHSVFSADGRFMYLICELGDELDVFRCDGGELSLISSRKAYDGDGHGSADIHISPDGRFLYTSHRLKKDGISIFRIDPSSGDVVNIGFCPTGRHPRNFAITPDGKYLLCACRDDNRIEIFSIDARSGMLEATGKSLDLPAPVCIQFWVAGK